MVTLFTISYNDETGELISHFPLDQISTVENKRELIVNLMDANADLLYRKKIPIPRGDDAVHIIPVDDIITHSSESFECKCGPECDALKGCVIHSALDGRKQFRETGDKKLWKAIKGKF